MSFTINNWFVLEYGRTVFTLAQQKRSRLRSRVSVDTGVVGKSKDHDRVGVVEMQAITSRHGDSPLNSVPHSRRRCTLSDFDTGDLIDKMDKIKTLNDPTNSYVMAHASAAGRRIDDTIIASALAAATTVTDGETTGTQAFDTTASTSGGQTVEVDYVESGAAVNSNLTMPKVREMKRCFMRNEVPEDEPLTAVVSASQIMSLLQDDEVTSADYTSLQALMAGTITHMPWMGFTWVHSERLATDASSLRRVLAFSRRGIQCDFGQDAMQNIAVRADKRFSVYAYICMSLGSVRMDEDEVVEVKCDET